MDLQDHDMLRGFEYRVREHLNAARDILVDPFTRGGTVKADHLIQDALRELNGLAINLTRQLHKDAGTGVQIG